ncbi:MAG: PqqD family protein [Ruminococcaceae bacterium]|nr:PqqD family protein [Oscillospiraceae bacterium]
MKYKICNNIEVTKVDGEDTVICFDVESGESHILDVAATAVLNTVGMGMTLDEAVSEIAAEFDAESGEISEGVSAFTQTLINKKIIEEAV